MNKTKIDWCDMTWNPVTGCYHGCGYCYARRIAERFGEMPCMMGNCNYAGDCGKEPSYNCSDYNPYEKIHDLEYPKYLYNPKRPLPYPYGFEPTFYRYRLDQPKNKVKPRNVFVCSMADLFGEWVPNEWIEKVFEACLNAPHHNYIFLTKNPKRYTELQFKIPFPTSDKFWYGTTVNSSADFIPPCRAEELSRLKGCKKFLSIEPILSEIHGIALQNLRFFQWVIVGAETGNRKNKVISKLSWIETIVKECKNADVPVFMKDNLKNIWKGDLIQEYPKELAVWHI